MNDSKNPKSSRDTNQRAQLVTDNAIGDVQDRLRTADGKDAEAVLLGRRGGLKGGRVRAERLPPEERRRIAKLAANARWAKRDLE